VAASVAVGSGFGGLGDSIGISRAWPARRGVRSNRGGRWAETAVDGAAVMPQRRQNPSLHDKRRLEGSDAS